MDRHDAVSALIKKNKETILSRWIHDIEHHPHLASSELKNKPNLTATSQQLFGHILTTIESGKLPVVSKETVEPILNLWHTLIHSQVGGGFSTKDTAMLIFSLKTTLQSLLNDPKTSEQELESFHQFEQLLDILGILTFEMYSVENEKLISRQNKQIQYLQSELTVLDGQIIGSSEQMNQLYKTIGLVLENDLTVLLQGESGTGKDFIANIIHQNSKRKDKPFIAVNCGAIPRELMESELFGHEKGAFTDASAQRLGKFELAHGGTLFLDEIGELPVDLQVKLLRVIQNREIQRVGGDQQIKVNIRIIAATNQDLKMLVDKKQFRLDLFYRLNVFPMTVPPLRDRKADIVPLATHFLELYSKQFNLVNPGLTNDGAQYLTNQYWEGNIRELENVIQRAIVLSQGQPISSTVLSLTPGQSGPVMKQLAAPESKLDEKKMPHIIRPLEETEKEAIANALTQCKRNMVKVAKALGISRTTLYTKIEKYGL